MKTEEQIRQEYVKKVTERSYQQDEARTKGENGEIKDRSKDIYVTDICVWNCYCPKQVYYNKVCKRPALPEALIRFTIGHVVHEIPLWDNEDPKLNGHEQAFTWNGIRCRMDEITFEEGIIVDKKTVASIPRSPKEYVTQQLNIYKIIAEENTERPTKINQLFVINLAVMNGQIQVQSVPIWERSRTMEMIEKTMSDIRSHVETKTPPEKVYDKTNWLCAGCQYTDLCKNDVPQVVKGIQTCLIDEPIQRGTMEIMTSKKH
ncbi:MAG: Dna2/Cas4 domain-containing protein [bacterium]